MFCIDKKIDEFNSHDLINQKKKDSIFYITQYNTIVIDTSIYAHFDYEKRREKKQFVSFNFVYCVVIE